MPQRKSEAESAGSDGPMDEEGEKKRLRKVIRDLHPKEEIEKHSGGKKLDAMSVDELVTLRDALAEG